MSGGSAAMQAGTPLGLAEGRLPGRRAPNSKAPQASTSGRAHLPAAYISRRTVHPAAVHRRDCAASVSSVRQSDALPGLVLGQAGSQEEDPLAQQRLARRAERQRHAATYQAAAIAATVGIGGLAVFATYYRIAVHLQHGEDFPVAELAATLALACGGAIGMEMYARWAHKFLWHDLPGGWALHKSHHEPRVGAFEANDIYALANALPAMALCAYGFLRPDVVGGLCFGAGLGITLFGISYMFVHDGLVHRRFPVGPIAEVPLLKRIAAAHRLHHSEKYGGLPYGMFLGPQELEAVGAGADLDELVSLDLGGGKAAGRGQ